MQEGEPVSDETIYGNSIMSAAANYRDYPEVAEQMHRNQEVTLWHQAQRDGYEVIGEATEVHVAWFNIEDGVDLDENGDPELIITPMPKEEAKWVKRYIEAPVRRIK